MYTYDELTVLDKGRQVQKRLTEFGQEMWMAAAKRGITTQTVLARKMGITNDKLHNYMHGRSSVPPSALKALDKALTLTEDEKERLAWTFAWGRTTREKAA